MYGHAAICFCRLCRGDTKNKKYKGEDVKLPNPKGGEATMNMKSMPEPTSDPTGSDYLKAKHIGKLGAKGKLTLLGKIQPEADNSFSDFSIMVKYNGTEYKWSQKFSGGNYRRLFEKYGKNPAKWKGVVNVEIKNHMNNDYIAVV